MPAERRRLPPAQAGERRSAAHAPGATRAMHSARLQPGRVAKQHALENERMGGKQRSLWKEASGLQRSYERLEENRQIVLRRALSSAAIAVTTIAGDKVILM